MTYFIREFEFPLDFSGNALLIRYEVSNPRARVGDISVRKDFDEEGRLLREYGVIGIFDEGSPAHPKLLKTLVLVRRLNDIVPLPSEASVPIGFLQSSGGRFQCYVCQGRGDGLPIGSTAEGTTSPPPERESSIRVSNGSTEQCCPCVVAGPTVHASASAETTSEGEPSDWW